MAQLGLPDGGWLAKALRHADLGRKVRITTDAGTWIGDLHSIAFYNGSKIVFLTIQNRRAKADVRLDPDHPIEFL